MKFKEWLILTEKIMIKDQEFRNPFLALQQIRKIHPNPENLVVTYTKIDKVGINPQSIYETPLGIYLYPLDYVIEEGMHVPFAGNEPHINVCEFTRPEKILHMTSDVSNQKGMELLNAFPKEQVDQASKSIDKYEIRSNYSKLWAVTRTLANENPIQWNANFRKCGIDGFVDHGTKTIHGYEPTQCVVFAANALKLLHSIENPIFYKKTDKFGVDTYKMKKNKYDSSKMSDEQIIKMLQSRRYYLDVENLLSKATDKEKMANVIIKYKPELSTFDIGNLIDFTTDTYQMAKLILEKKPELDNWDVETLLSKATDKDKMAELIISKMPEINDDNVQYLLLKANNKEKIAEILQKETDNISKLDDDSVDNFFDELLHKTKDKPKIAQIINKYHTKKTPVIQKILDKYLPQTIAAK